MNVDRYAKPESFQMTARGWPAKQIERAPIWNAVDLRDGNQALPDPMTPAQKKRYFQLLCEIGFKEIEVGFPSASRDDFQFCRDLIEQNFIPEDVTIAVLTPAREHLIKKTFEALKGLPKAICHLYIATSDLHVKYVFNKTREDVRKMALDGVDAVRREAEAMPDMQVRLQFSPEEFTDTDMDFAVSLCDQVVEAWEPAEDEKVILNLPATVERRMPNEYADMIEEFCRRQRHRERSIISVHAHNDMGCAVASSQMTLLAGADRVEGTLFGHGERSGNVDLVTLALNLQYFGIDTGLDFSNIEEIRDEVIELTAMPLSPRHPYAGELVFSAFSGSHQDAIHKGLSGRDKLAADFGAWKIPYLHVDPGELGRRYEKFIRINSQSGKGGIAHVLESDYQVRLPKTVLADFSPYVQRMTDQTSREVHSQEIWDLFNRCYNRPEGPLQLENYWPRPNNQEPARIDAEVHVCWQGEKHVLTATGNGPVAAFVHAVKQLSLPEFSLEEYEEDAIGSSAEAQAVAFIRLDDSEKRQWYGLGFDQNIDQAAVHAIVSAINRMLTE